MFESGEEMLFISNNAMLLFGDEFNMAYDRV